MCTWLRFFFAEVVGVSVIGCRVLIQGTDPKERRRSEEEAE